MMKNLWEGLDASVKRMVVAGSVIAGIVMILAVFVGNNDSQPVQRNKHSVGKDRTILTGQPIKEMNIDRIQAELKRLKAKNKNLDRKLTRLELANKQPGGAGRVNPKDIEAIVNQKVTQALAAHKAAQSSVHVAKMERVGKDNKAPSQVSEKRVDHPKVKHQGVTVLPDSDNPFANQKHASETSQTNGSLESTQANNSPKRALKIRHVVDKNPPKPVAKVVKGTFIPAGSRFDGILLNGVDAGTGKQARENPYPVAVRIKKEAVLPNRFKLSDVKECFLMASGYGELSSERVHLRTESISCIRKDHGVLEAKINMYAVGEDSKAGIRGRLVSKQGQLLAKALMAGFFQGVAGAFNQQAIPAINTTAAAGSPVGYQSLLSGQTLQTGAAKGFGTAFDRLSKFYIDMAEQIFPILEIDAGRKVSFQMTNGVQLQFKEQN